MRQGKPSQAGAAQPRANGEHLRRCVTGGPRVKPTKLLRKLIVGVNIIHLKTGNLHHDLQAPVERREEINVFTGRKEYAKARLTSGMSFQC